MDTKVSDEYSPKIIRYDGEGRSYHEYIAADVPTVVREGLAGDLLLDLTTREVIGVRVYEGHPPASPDIEGLVIDETDRDMIERGDRIGAKLVRALLAHHDQSSDAIRTLAAERDAANHRGDEYEALMDGLTAAEMDASFTRMRLRAETAEASLAQMAGDGFVVVPREPTEAMQIAGLHALSCEGLADCDCDQKDVWGAMIAAALQNGGGDQ